MSRFRTLKSEIKTILGSPDWHERLGEITRMDGRRTLGPLFSLILSPEGLYWRAVTAAGAVVAETARQRMEQARIFFRRMIWNLNEESGNLGWGMCEIMGEAMSRNSKLAEEYHRILASYVHDGGETGNYLDHDLLRRGAYWGLGRLAQQGPDLVRRAVPDLVIALSDADAHNRGYAAWTLGLLKADQALPQLEKLKSDRDEIRLFRGAILEDIAVADLALEAIQKIKS